MTDEIVLQTAREAYMYAMPLVVMDLTMKNMTNPDLSGKRDVRRVNQFSHSREIFTAKDRMVVRPNIDTLYSNGWLDLSKEPVVFSKPDTRDIYCSIAVFDAHTNCQYVLGSGGIDNGKAAVYVFCGPDYDVPTPPGIIKLNMPTNMVWLIGRTENLPGRLNDIYAIQDKLTLVPLSQKNNAGYIPSDGVYNPDHVYEPKGKLEGMDIVSFFNAFNSLLTANPGTAADKPALDKFAKIGVGAGLTFNLKSFSSKTQKALQELPRDITKALGTPEYIVRYSDIVNGWLNMDNDIARWGTNYEYRAIIALTGLGANPADMAIYPSALGAVEIKPGSDPQPHGLDGKTASYAIHFKLNDLPTCAFWSITVYDKEGFFYENLYGDDLYAITDKYNLEENLPGQATVLMQHQKPVSGNAKNWLPIPNDAFQLTMRIYLPGEKILSGEWKPPVIVVVP
jgi:hypothetical protein